METWEQKLIKVVGCPGYEDLCEGWDRTGPRPTAGRGAELGLPHEAETPEGANAVPGGESNGRKHPQFRAVELPKILQI